MQAIPKPKISKNFLYIGIAIVLAVLASLMAVGYVQNQVAERTRDDRVMIQVAVPTADMPQGAMLTEADLAIREMPAEYAPADAVTPDNYMEYQGRLLRAPVRGGAPLSASALVPLYDQFSRVIPKGKVAYTLSVNENNSISGMLAPGDLIDIMFVMDADDNESGGAQSQGRQIYPLLEQIKILATGTRVGETIAPEGQPADAGTQGFSTVTLELDHSQANRLAIAEEAGDLRVLLRRVDDTVTAGANAMTEAQLLELLGKYGAPGDTNRIDFIIGGKG